MWHHQSMIALVRIVLRLLTDLIALAAFTFRQRRAVAAEILVLRRQIALYRERGIKPRRIDAVTRISLGLLSRFFNWRGALVVVRPETMIRWHRAGWRLFWRLKSRPGRPPIPLQIQALIRLSHLRCILKSWIPHYNFGRPHMALGPGLPDPPLTHIEPPQANSRHRRGESYAVHAKPVTACRTVVFVYTMTIR